MPRRRPAMPPGAEIPLPATGPLLVLVGPIPPVPAAAAAAAAPPPAVAVPVGEAAEAGEGLGARAGRGARAGAGALPAGVRSGSEGCMLGRDDGTFRCPPGDAPPLELREVICACARASQLKARAAVTAATARTLVACQIHPGGTRSG